jgi:hypothetical protein
MLKVDFRRGFMFILLRAIAVVSLSLFLLCGCERKQGHPFRYDLHLSHIPGTSGQTMICFHGMGGDHRIGQYIKECAQLDETLISFNFPDWGLTAETYNPFRTSFGTIYEVLPALYVLKKTIIDDGMTNVNLYGFSAGGGAVINTLGVLNSTTYDAYLEKIGIGPQEKERILAVIQQGYIILDTPLKSIDEIIALYGNTRDIAIIGGRYLDNKMNPIAVLERLSNLSLHFIVHFQNPDEVLSNRDDELFIELLEKFNTKGSISVILGQDNGHSFPHPSLWQEYSRF